MPGENGGTWRGVWVASGTEGRQVAIHDPRLLETPASDPTEKRLVDAGSAVPNLIVPPN